MSITVTRLNANDLQELITQVGGSATLANCITGLQCYKNGTSAPLNTICPTCQVGGVAQGWLNVTIGASKTNQRVICYTCGGYLKVYTSGGSAAVTNPFGSQITTSRCKPADLLEAINTTSSSETLSACLTALQAASSATNTCPVCSGSGQITVGTNKNACYLCQGVGLTVLAYTLTNGVPTLVATAPSPTAPTSPLPGSIPIIS